MSRRLKHLFLILAGLLLAQAGPGRTPTAAEAPVTELPAAWTARAEAELPDPVAPVSPERALQDEPDPSEEPIYAENQLVVRFAPGTPEEVKRALHEDYGAQVVREIPVLDIQILQLPEDTVAMVSAYQAQEEVRYAEPDYLFHIQGAPSPEQPDLTAPSPQGLDVTPDDTLFRQQWHHETIDSAGAWDIERGNGVTIAIIDTGVDCTHPDLTGHCLRGYDHVNNDSDPRDDHGHGTHVAGIAAGVTNNALGIAGTGWDAKFMPVKALSARGSGNLSWIAAAVTWSVDNGADVINMSLGGRFTSRALQDAIAYAIERGVPVIAAAGNDNTSNPSYPAAYSGVIGVAATTRSDTKSNFSNYGDYIDVAAPGSAILSTVRGGSYQAWDGTSMASPVVAGVAGLLMAQGPCRTPRDIEQVLEQTAVDLGSRGWDRIYGAGRIDAAAALAQDRNPCGGSPAPTATPDPSDPGGPVSPTPKPSPTPLPTRPPASGGEIDEVERLINQQRAAQGLPPLAVLEGLRRAAGKHSLDMSLMRQCSHYGSNGSDPASRMRAEGIRVPYGEIVACGQASPAAAVEAWMGSPGHRAIILCGSCTSLGAGFASSSSGYRRYWTVNFAADSVSAPTPTDPPTAAPPTATPMPTPTTAPTGPTSPPPTSLPGSTDIVLQPITGRAGWVVSTEPYTNHFDSADMFTGVWNDRAYHGAMQFDLSVIPADAHVNFARLEMYGRSSGSLTRTGTWSVNLLEPGIDRGFEGHGYAAIHSAGVESMLLPLLGAVDIDEGRLNTFNFTTDQLEGLKKRVSTTAQVSFRMDGPTSGEFANLASWDTGQGEKSTYRGPVLFINYSIGKPVPYPTPTATEPPPVTPDPGLVTPPPTEPTTPTATAPNPPPTSTPRPTVPPTPRPDDLQKTIELVPSPDDVGWVRSHDPKSYLGTRNTFTGYYMQQEYHGLAQFDLSQLPRNRVITHARLTLTGQSTQRLSAVGNGRWEVAILASDVDAGWQYHGFKRIDDTRAIAKLDPYLLQADLDVGKENLFVLRPDELRELGWRAITTGKISFRFDGPRGGTANVFDWDAGYGGNPPKLTVVMGPPTSDNPLPPAPPSDPERIERLLRAVNDARAQAGLRDLELSDRLTRAAEQHTWDMTAHRFFDHIGSDGSTPEERVARNGFEAEKVRHLIAGQNGDPESIVQAWLRSGEHSERIMDPTLTHFGAYYDYAPGTFFGHYWTLVLAEAKR